MIVEKYGADTPCKGTKCSWPGRIQNRGILTELDLRVQLFYPVKFGRCFTADEYLVTDEPK